MSKTSDDEEAVLLVDDDPNIRETLSELLDANGYEVLEAENGQIALDVLRNVRRFPCVVLLDLSMPVLDGREFLRRRASDPVLRDIPVVVVSGSNSPPDTLEGIDEYLRKPVKFERLIEVLEHYR